MDSWWRKKDSDVQRFAHRVAEFHTQSKAWPLVSEYTLSSRRRAFKSDIVKTANQLQLVANQSDACSANEFARHLFKRPFAQRAAVLVAHIYNERFQTPLSMNQAKDFAYQVGKTFGLNEEITPRKKLKPNGTYRPYWEFGPVRYSQQTLVKWLLEANTVPSAFDFGLPGRGGIHGAAEKIAQSLQDDYRYWVVTDIKSAFPSITLGHIRPYLNLGRQLERYVVYPRLPILGEQDETPANEPACRQLPQGAAHASFVLSAVVDGCLRSSLPSEVVAVVYADNIAIGAQSMQRAKRAFFAIEKAFSELPRGLTLHKTKLCDGRQHADGGAPVFQGEFACFNSIDFCGYRLSQDILTSEVRIRPSEEAWNKFWARVKMKVIARSSPWDKNSLLVDEAFHKWRAGLHLWKPNADALELYETRKTSILAEELC